MMSDKILEVTLWVCPHCHYWRAQKSTGVHQTDNPEDWRGRQVVHELVPVRFYSEHHPSLQKETV